MSIFSKSKHLKAKPGKRLANASIVKFDKHFPTIRLRPYVRYFVVSENAMENNYKVFPSSSLVMGFQYKGQLAAITDDTEKKLTSAGITGILDRHKVFKTPPTQEQFWCTLQKPDLRILHRIRQTNYSI